MIRIWMNSQQFCVSVQLYSWRSNIDGFLSQNASEKHQRVAAIWHEHFQLLLHQWKAVGALKQPNFQREKFGLSLLYFLDAFGKYLQLTATWRGSVLTDDISKLLFKIIQQLLIEEGCNNTVWGLLLCFPSHRKAMGAKKRKKNSHNCLTERNWLKCPWDIKALARKIHSVISWREMKIRGPRRSRQLTKNPPNKWRPGHFQPMHTDKGLAFIVWKPAQTKLITEPYWFSIEARQRCYSSCWHCCWHAVVTLTRRFVTFQKQQDRNARKHKAFKKLRSLIAGAAEDEHSRWFLSH